MCALMYTMLCLVLSGVPSALAGPGVPHARPMAPTATAFPTIEGLARRYADPRTLPGGGAQLEVRNPHVARCVLRLDGIDLGEVDPLGWVRLQGLRAGPWQLHWITPDGFERAEEVIATAPPPARSSRSSSR